MMQVQTVTHSFGDRVILNQITLTLTERRIGIVGSNGSGKSTFVRLLNGLLIPDQGDVWVDQLNTRRHTKAVRRKVGFVFQNPDNQIVFPIVEEDLAFGLKNLRLSRAEIADRIDTILQRYDLEPLRHQPTHLLSGGEKQLLAIASVLVMHPQYIIFDEPTTLLDLRNRNRIQRTLWQLEQPIVVVSHDLELLKDFDRVIVFEAGKVVMDDHPAIALPYYIQLMS
jgi:biotin transport system ATP-binding protein